MIQFVLLVIISVLILYSTYKWGTRNFDYFKKQNLKFLKPYPLIGTNTWFFKLTSLAELTKRNYNKYPDEKIFGIFDFNSPIFYIRDPKIIKQLTVKDFDYFVDRKSPVDTSDEFFNSLLPSMKGKRWREMRSSLSPAFTGSKMRHMFELVSNCGQEMVQYFCEDFEKHGLKIYDMKDIFAKFTTDVIASCAFGIKCDSLKYPDNEFYQMGKIIMDIRSPLKIFKILFMRMAPGLTKKLDLQFFDKNSRIKFNEMIIETMAIRKRDGIIRPDMINLLMQLKDGNLKKLDENLDSNDIIGQTKEQINVDDDVRKTSWTDMELIAQCFLFFLAGFDTSSTLMQFIAYELAVNPDVQLKLTKEIDEIHDSLSGKLLTYEALQQLKYMEMIISETLRKWPPGLLIDRVCVKDYSYEDEDGLKFTIEKGQAFLIPVYGLHMDEKYFPNPTKFDPERFRNKENIDMNVYLPFGSGPRNCIGSRFALMQTKAVIYYLLLNFTFEISEKTVVPLKLKKTLLGLMPNEKIQLYLKPRNKHKVYYLSNN